MNRFKDLIVYQKSKELVIFVYKMLADFPDAERFALCGQMRRAAISVPSNIVEGMARLSTKDQSHFLNIAYGSLMELYAQLDIAHDLGYLSEDDFAKIGELIALCVTDFENKKDYIKSEVAAICKKYPLYA